MKKIKYGLALEGGGAKGAYEIGVVKALIEAGYKFSAVTGTSIGALNAAMIVQNRLDDALELWSNITYEKMFNVDDNKVDNALKAKIDLDIIKYFSTKLGKALKNGGISTDNIRKILNENVDEALVRKSSIKFGLVTVCLSDKSAEEKFIEEIPKGELIDYLMATSSLPVFKRAKINNKSYLDGGVYDNCPVEMLEKQGIKNIIAIRNYKRMRIRNYKALSKKDDVNLIMIEPVDNLPGILKFEAKNTKALIELGYYDGLKFINNLDGIRYYINPKEEKYYFNLFANYDLKKLQKIADMLEIEYSDLENLRKVMFEYIINELVAKTNQKEALNYKEAIYAMLEYLAKEEEIEKFKIYEFEEFLNIVKKNLSKIKDKKINKALIEFVKNLEI